MATRLLMTTSKQLNCVVSTSLFVLLVACSVHFSTEHLWLSQQPEKYDVMLSWSVLAIGTTNTYFRLQNIFIGIRSGLDRQSLESTLTLELHRIPHALK